MRKGFVFGKYLPFHKGHEALIDFAITQCDFLYIVVCCSNKESIDAKTRTQWIEASFETNKNIEIIALDYNEETLPNTSIPSVSVSKVWAEKFKSILPTVDLLITSEKYGDYVAAFMQIRHLPFDFDRKKFPISSSLIKKNVPSHWSYLPDAVKRYFQKKIVFLGTESTGKSSLSKALATKYNTSLVEEVGREIIPNSNTFSEEQLQQIAQAHAKNILTASKALKPFIFIDTDIHITQSYAKFQFGKYLDISDEIYVANKADFYFYLSKDLTFVQDGTRLDENNRNALDISHRKTLKDFGIEFMEVSGSWEQRFERISKLLANYPYF